jgi:hypothetical protein
MSGYDPIHNWNSIQSLKPYHHEGERANDYDKLLLPNVGMESEKNCWKIDN